MELNRHFLLLNTSLLFSYLLANKRDYFKCGLQNLPWFVKRLIIALERHMHKKNWKKWILEIGICFPTRSMECAPLLFLKPGTQLKWGWLNFAFWMQQKLPILLREMFKARKLFSSNLDLFEALNYSPWTSPEGWSLLLWARTWGLFWKISSAFLLSLGSRIWRGLLFELRW